MNAQSFSAQSSTTLVDVLRDLRSAGFGGQFVPQKDGSIRCTNCSAAEASGAFQVAGYRRVEGASDAADLSLVAWTRCPSCSTGGVLTLGYGPNATPSDEAVFCELELDTSIAPGATPREATWPQEAT